MASAFIEADIQTGGESDLAARLLASTCRVFGVTEGQLHSSDRAGVSEARWALSYVLINSCGWSYSRVGRLLNKNHAAIIYGNYRASEMRKNSEAFYEALQIIEGAI